MDVLSGALSFVFLNYCSNDLDNLEAERGTQLNDNMNLCLESLWCQIRLDMDTFRR